MHQYLDTMEQSFSVQKLMQIVQKEKKRQIQRDKYDAVLKWRNTLYFSDIVLMYVTFIFDFINPKYVANIFKRWEYSLPINIPGKQFYVFKHKLFAIIITFGDFRGSKWFSEDHSLETAGTLD